MKQSKILAVYTTCADRTSAEQLATAVIEARLAACIQLDEITSFYRWEGRVAHEPEIRLLFKLPADRYSALEQLICARHSYDLPELIAVPVENGLPDYLDWVRDECGQ